jgi:hypothetical protein
MIRSLPITLFVLLILVKRVHAWLHARDTAAGSNDRRQQSDAQ